MDESGKKVEAKLTNVACPKCEKPMALRKGRFGLFLSCSTYPKCHGVVNIDRKGCVKPPAGPPLQVDLSCPKCAAPLNLRRSRRGPWLSCSKFPKCRGRQGWRALSQQQRKDLEAQLLDHEKAHPQPVIKDIHGNPIIHPHTPQEIETPPQDDNLKARQDPEEPKE